MPFYDNPYTSSFDAGKLFDDITFVKADRMPCPVCGHPTGDCKSTDNPQPVRIAGFGLSESLKEVQTYLLEEDIYEERQITPFLKTRVLVHRKGKQIPYAEAERLGLIQKFI